MTLLIELGKRSWPPLFIGGKENRQPGTGEAPTAACASEAERGFQLCLGHQPLCPSPVFILSSVRARNSRKFTPRYSPVIHA